MKPGDSAAWLLRQFDTAWALAEHHLAMLTSEECHWRPADPCLHVGQDAEGRWHADWPAHEGHETDPPSIASTGWQCSTGGPRRCSIWTA